MSAQAIALFLEADVFLRFKNSTTGLFGNRVKIETEKLEVTTPSDLKEKTSKGRNKYGQVFISHRLPKPVEFAITFSELNKEIFALMLSGVLEEVNDVAATLTDFVVPTTKDEWVKVGDYSNLDPANLTVKPNVGTDPLVLGTDYELNPRLGLIKALTAGATGTVKVTGKTLAVTGSRIIGGRSYSHTMSIEVDGLNQLTGKNVTFTAGQATVSSEEAHDFLSGELDSAPLKGRLEIPAGGDRPFEMVIYD